MLNLPCAVSVVQNHPHNVETARNQSNHLIGPIMNHVISAVFRYSLVFVHDSQKKHTERLERDLACSSYQNLLGAPGPELSRNVYGSKQSKGLKMVDKSKW